MSFDIKLALGFAIGAVALLGYAGIRNKRSGYERKREDTMWGILMASAQARAILFGDGDKNNVAVEAAPQRLPDARAEQSLSSALISLQQALGESSPVEAASSPVESMESTQRTTR